MSVDGNGFLFRLKRPKRKKRSQISSFLFVAFALSWLLISKLLLFHEEDSKEYWTAFYICTMIRLFPHQKYSRARAPALPMSMDVCAIMSNIVFWLCLFACVIMLIRSQMRSVLIDRCAERGIDCDVDGVDDDDEGGGWITRIFVKNWIQRSWKVFSR